MAALISVLIAITLSLLITRIATEALTLTGLSRTSARFQARSAFTGTGFATSESEAIVKHPLRRRIIVLVRVPLRLAPNGAYAPASRRDFEPIGSVGRTACG